MSLDNSVKSIDGSSYGKCHRHFDTHDICMCVCMPRKWIAYCALFLWMELQISCILNSCCARKNTVVMCYILLLHTVVMCYILLLYSVVMCYIMLLYTVVICYVLLSCTIYCCYILLSCTIYCCHVLYTVVISYMWPSTSRFVYNMAVATYCCHVLYTVAIIILLSCAILCCYILLSCAI